MAFDDALILLINTENTPTDDTSTMGGAPNRGSVIANADVGELVTRFTAKASGTLYDSEDVEKQYQEPAIWNGNDEDAFDVHFWFDNLIKTPSAALSLTFQSDSTDDDDIMADWWGDIASALVNHQTNLSGTDLVDSLFDPVRVFRIIFRNQITGAIQIPAGNVTVRSGSEIIAVCRGGGDLSGGYYSLTNEVSMGVFAATDDVTTTANRRTAPDGVTFYQPFDESEALYVRNDPDNATLLGITNDPESEGEANKLCIEYVLQPGMPGFNGVEVGIRIAGSEVAP